MSRPERAGCRPGRAQTVTRFSVLAFGPSLLDNAMLAVMRCGSLVDVGLSLPSAPLGLLVIASQILYRTAPTFAILGGEKGSPTLFERAQTSSHPSALLKMRLRYDLRGSLRLPAGFPTLHTRFCSS